MSLEIAHVAPLEGMEHPRRWTGIHASRKPNWMSVMNLLLLTNLFTNSANQNWTYRSVISTWGRGHQINRNKTNIEAHYCTYNLDEWICREPRWTSSDWAGKGSTWIGRLVPRIIGNKSYGPMTISVRLQHRRFADQYYFTYKKLNGCRITYQRTPLE